DLDRERGSKVSKVLGENAWFITMDVADEKQVAQGVAEVLGQFGRLDALVCNAAVADPRNITLESLDLASWNRVLAVNLSGP
ncbi:SDR family NAD(P)-dependent oxidoreductase, partial [Salmonella enterica subsp. enterica serovar Braenderup]